MTDKAHFWEGLVYYPVSRSSHGEGMTVCEERTVHGCAEYALTCLLMWRHLVGDGAFATGNQITNSVGFIDDAFKKPEIPNNNLFFSCLIRFFLTN